MQTRMEKGLIEDRILFSKINTLLQQIRVAILEKWPDLSLGTDALSESATQSLSDQRTPHMFASSQQASLLGAPRNSAILSKKSSASVIAMDIGVKNWSDQSLPSQLPHMEFPDRGPLQPSCSDHVLTLRFPLPQKVIAQEPVPVQGKPCRTVLSQHLKCLKNNRGQVPRSRGQHCTVKWSHSGVGNTVKRGRAQLLQKLMKPKSGWIFKVPVHSNLAKNGYAPHIFDEIPSLNEGEAIHVFVESLHDPFSKFYLQDFVSFCLLYFVFHFPWDPGGSLVSSSLAHALAVSGLCNIAARFSEVGCLPKWVCIDDGWQNTTQITLENGELPIGARLQNLKENAKFKGKGYGDLHQFIRSIKQKYGLKYVYAWHALLGYWGGLDPLSDEMRKYNPQIEPIVNTPGNLSHVVCGVVQMLEKVGVGLIDPLKVDEFSNDLHGYLARCGVDGGKVDVQCLLDTLGSGYGGRVTLTECFQEALEESVMKNFGGNSIICSMSTNNDYIFCSKRSASARVSDDLMPNEPTFQTLHVAAVAFNSLLLGEIVIPDWDMFHSTHYTADFHAAARALGGSPYYMAQCLEKFADRCLTKNFAHICDDFELFMKNKELLDILPPPCGYG